MPVSLVKLSAVSFSMSSICGLPTISDGDRLCRPPIAVGAAAGAAEQPLATSATAASIRAQNHRMFSRHV